jgi:hypothetical protein
MPTARQTAVYELAGLTIASTIEKTESAQIGPTITLPAGQAGTLTTRTADDDGEATLTDTPTVSNGDVADVFWDGGVRYGMDVGVVVGNVVPISSGAGDVLPAASTALVVTERVPISLAFDGDDVEMIAATCDQRAHLEFEDAGALPIYPIELAAADQAWSWIADTGWANPLTGNAVATVQAANGTAAAATLQLGVLYDSTP